MSFSEKVKLEVKRRAHFQCCRCQSAGVEVHHIVRRADGGSDKIANAAPLCPSCHSWFGDNPALRKEIRLMRDAWYERCKKQDEAGTIKMDEINRFFVKLEKNLKTRIKLEVGSVQAEIERLRSEISDLARQPRVLEDPGLVSRVQDLQSRATAVSGLITTGGFSVSGPVILRLPKCPNCQSTSVSTIVPGGRIGDAAPPPAAQYRCNSCGFTWPVL